MKSLLFLLITITFFGQIQAEEYENEYQCKKTYYCEIACARRNIDFWEIKQVAFEASSRLEASKIAYDKCDYSIKFSVRSLPLPGAMRWEGGDSCWRGYKISKHCFNPKTASRFSPISDCYLD